MKLICEKQPLGNIPILGRKAYLICKSDVYGWLVHGDQAIAFFIDKRLWFKRLIFTTSIFQLGEQQADEVLCDREFLQLAITKIREKRLCHFIYKAQSNVVFEGVPDYVEKVPWGTYIKDLHFTGEDELLQSFHGKHRNVVRKARSEGCDVRKVLDIDAFQKCVAETMIRQKVPFFPAKSYLLKLAQEVPDNILLRGVYFNDVLQGCALVVYDDVRAYYMYGGSVGKPKSGALNYLHYEIMKELMALGVSSYDFVGARIDPKPGSKYEGLQMFKERFGANLHRGYAFRYVLSKYQFFLFNVIVRAYSRFKGLRYVDPIDSILGDI